MRKKVETIYDFVCDRCGAEYSERTLSEVTEGASLVFSETMGSAAVKTLFEWKDLCSDCIGQVRNFMGLAPLDEETQ